MKKRIRKLRCAFRMGFDKILFHRSRFYLSTFFAPNINPWTTTACNGIAYSRKDFADFMDGKSMQASSFDIVTHVVSLNSCRAQLLIVCY